MKCPNCLTESPVGTKKCPECGYDFMAAIKQQKKLEKKRKGEKTLKIILASLLGMFVLLLIIALFSSNNEQQKQNAQRAIRLWTKNGTITRLSIENNTAYVPLKYWNEYSDIGKQKILKHLSTYFNMKGAGRKAIILEQKTHKKLAEYLSKNDQRFY